MKLLKNNLFLFSLSASIVLVPIISLSLQTKNNSNSIITNIISQKKSDNISENVAPEIINDQTNPTNMSVYIKEDIVNLEKIKNLEFNQILDLERNYEYKYWKAFHDDEYEYEYEYYTYKASLQHDVKNDVQDGFTIDWNDSNNTFNGYWNIKNLYTDYVKKFGSNTPKNYYINYFYNFLGEGNKKNFDLKPYLRNSESNKFDYFNFDFNSDNNKQRIINDFSKFSINNNYAYNQPGRVTVIPAGQYHWTFKTFLRNLSKLSDTISGVNITDAKFIADMLKFNLNIPIDDNGLVFNAITSQTLVQRMFQFSDILSQIKTIQYAYLIRERINNEVIKLCHGKTIDLDDDSVLSNLSWNDEYGWRKSVVKGFVKQLNEFKFANYGALLRAEAIFFDSKEFEYFNTSDGTYEKIHTELSKNYLSLDARTLTDFKKLYDLIIMTFKSYNLVVNAQVLNQITNQFEDVYEIDEKGNKKTKEIVLWDGDKANFNLDFINDIGYNYTKWNDIRFKINDIKTIENSNYSQTNQCHIGFSDFHLKAYLEQINFINKEIYTNYRYNAINYEIIILNPKLRYKWMKYLSIYTNYQLSQLVHLTNDEKEQFYVNDLVESSTYNVQNIVLKSLNENLYATTLSGPTPPAHGYPLFSKILSGIGIGDLNKHFQFNKDPFFDMDSWNNALNKFDIISDKKFNKYPIFASSIKNNAFYVIATIDNWYFSNGMHGDFIKLYKTIIENQFKRNLETFDIDEDYLTMVEIEPSNRKNSNGSWDSIGYFLVKINVGSSNYSWFPSSATSHYQLSDESWNKAENQYIEPIEENSNTPYLNAGIVNLYGAKNADNSYRYWKNNLITKIDNNFFTTKTYKEINWELDLDLLMTDLEIKKEGQPRYNYLANLCENWIKYNNKYSDSDKAEMLSALRNRTYRSMFVKSAFKYFLDNVMIKMDIEETNQISNGFSFSNFVELENNWLFMKLLNLYDFKFEDIFVKQKIYVCDEDTKSTGLVLNKKQFKQISKNNFSYNKKIISYENNRMGIVNKNTYDNTFNPLTSIYIPSNLLLEATNNHYFNPPARWYSNDYDPYQTNQYFNSSAIRAMWLVDGLNERLINVKYVNDELIKIDENTSLNIENICIVVFTPIVVIMLFFVLAILFSSKRRKKL